ncbi:MAG: ROK family protein [Saprospiraceae bacterium]|nr:ROK family protein [Saprospiraceae bacterium]
MDVVVGIDIGGTKTKIGLVNKQGQVLEQTYFRTRHYPILEEYLDQIDTTIDILIRQCVTPVELLGIGIGAPNASSKNGTIEHASNLVWKGIVPIVEILQQRRALPTKLMNDASVAALGELLFGNAQNMTDFIVVTLGTGFGSGIVANGKLIDGYDGFAGELGHLDITLGDGRLTGQGVSGGLEAYVSATGLKRTVMYMLAYHMDDSRFRSIAYTDLHGEEITQAADEGDLIAIKAFDYTAKILGTALANFVAFTQPQAFILMGGLADSQKWLVEPARKYMEASLLPFYKGKVQLLSSGLKKSEAAICGAASLIWQDYGVMEV